MLQNLSYNDSQKHSCRNLVRISTRTITNTNTEKDCKENTRKWQTNKHPPHNHLTVSHHYFTCSPNTDWTQIYTARLPPLSPSPIDNPAHHNPFPPTIHLIHHVTPVDLIHSLWPYTVQGIAFSVVWVFNSITTVVFSFIIGSLNNTTTCQQ